MNANERDTDPPSPDSAAPEPGWEDPWSWRAYPDAAEDETAPVPAAEPSDPEPSPEPASDSDEEASPEPVAAPDPEDSVEPGEPAEAEPAAPEETAADRVEPAEQDEPTDSPESPEQAQGAEQPEQADDQGPAALDPAETPEALEPQEAGDFPEPAEAGDSVAPGEQAEPEEPAVAEEQAAVEEPLATPEWIEPVGLSDWDERVRLLEDAEPEEPGDLREPGDFWDLGEPAGSEPPEEPPGADDGEPGEPAESAEPYPAEPEAPAALAPSYWPPPPPPWSTPPPVPRPLPPGTGQRRPPALPPGPTLPRPAPLRPGSPRTPPPRMPPSRGGWSPPAGLDSPSGWGPAPAPAPARTRRRGWIIGLAIVVALAVMVVQLVQLGLLRRPEPAVSTPPGAHAAAGGSASTGPGASASTRSPQAQVVRLLASRADALLRHDKAAFLATVDQRRRTFYRSQAVLFDRMATVPFASLSYTVPDPLQDVGSDRARQRYSPTVVSMFPVQASFRFRGQDASPFLARFYYTFAVTDSGWRIAGQDDTPSSLRSDVEIWDSGAVRTVSTARTLVVFHSGDATLARRLLSVAERGYGQVAASWSASWDKRVVILVPRDQREAQRLVQSRDLSDVAAVTSSVVEAGPLHRLLGNRIIVNTSLLEDYGTLDLQVVLTHEMTHVATRKIGVGVPLYLVEGFADFTALRPLDAPVRVTRPSLAAAVRAGRFKGKLPSRSQLVGSDAALAYDEGSTFCLWVESTFGEAKLQALYSSFGDLVGDPSHQDEDLRFRRVLKISRATAEARWAAFVKGPV